MSEEFLLLIFQEFPFVRYRAAKSLDVSTETTKHDLIPTKLAARVWDRLALYKQRIEHFPQTETCDLIILDRSVDQVFICISYCKFIMLHKYISCLCY